MTLVVVVALAGLALWIVAKEHGWEKGYDEAIRDTEQLLAAREKSVVAREARKRCQVGRAR
jgi:hypothetical protein